MTIWIAICTTLQHFGTPKTLIFRLFQVLSMKNQLQITRIGDNRGKGRSEASERSGLNGYMEWVSEPEYTRPSHEDGTFTTANSINIYYYITALLYYYITILLYYYITILLHYYITTLLHYYITILLYYYITILLYYYITILLY